MGQFKPGTRLHVDNSKKQPAVPGKAGDKIWSAIAHQDHGWVKLVGLVEGIGGDQGGLVQIFARPKLGQESPRFVRAQNAISQSCAGIGFGEVNFASEQGADDLFLPGVTALQNSLGDRAMVGEGGRNPLFRAKFLRGAGVAQIPLTLMEVISGDARRTDGLQRRKPLSNRGLGGHARFLDGVITVS